MIALLPCPVSVAQAVVGFTPVGLAHVADWPHEDTPDALRGLAEHGPFEGSFLIVEDGVVVGDCGWFGPPDEDGEVEIGYGLARSARGRGVASAAVTLLIAWCQAQGARAVRAEVLPGNEPSWQLLRRLGFEHIGHRAGHDLYLL